LAVVEKGEIKWDDDDNWEVERILDHVEEEVSICKTLTIGKWREFWTMWKKR
jgi:hypothetical protein